ncbi:hypothetical protein ACJRO7_026546 [Eucalyptus globulus]|uniref:Uncharacterized protein n=1 Tax=Eucalyptus globulus TaxID=34317 RepID=A0ABD3JPD5_EUCGL
MENLRDFTAGKDFYQQTGGPGSRATYSTASPGWGNQANIAAMANFLGYDIYDLELTKVCSNSKRAAETQEAPRDRQSRKQTSKASAKAEHEKARPTEHKRRSKERISDAQ